MQPIEQLSSVDHALILTQQMESAIEQTAHAIISPSEIVDPLIPSIIHEDNSEDKLNVYRKLSDLSIDAVFPVNELDTRAGIRTGRNREGVIRDSVTDRRLIAASKAVQHYMRIRANVRVGRAEHARNTQ